MLSLAEPVPVGDLHRPDPERAARPDDDSRLLRRDSDHVKRLLLTADLDPAALADREMHHSTMLSQHPPFEVDDVTGRLGLGPEPLHQARIIAIGDEAD